MYYEARLDIHRVVVISPFNYARQDWQETKTLTASSRESARTLAEILAGDIIARLKLNPLTGPSPYVFLEDIVPVNPFRR